MKKIVYLIMAFTMVFTTACDPMEDVYKEIGESENVIVGDAVYPMSEDDYAELGVDDGFSSIDEAKTLLPDFLTGLYPVWGKDSSVLVEYQMTDGLSNLEEVNAYADAESYRLMNTDYPGAADNATGFYPGQDPSNYIPALLDVNIENPVEGQLVLATYKQYVGEVSKGLSEYYREDFSGDLGGFEVINVAGTKEWYASEYGEGTSFVDYAKMGAYGNGQNEDWLISPEIDLSSQTNASFQMNQATPFVLGNWDLISVVVSIDYTTGEDHTAATWDTLTIQPMPSGDAYDYDYVLSDLVDLSAYDGEKIHIAFKYLATDDTAPTWQIDYALIKVPGVEGSTDGEGMYFIYDSGEWVVSEGVYYLSDSDYDSMGSGPGKYNNFSSSVMPNSYIPTFLTLDIPYAQEEDLLIVMYKYYSGGTKVRGNVYEVANGEWVGNSPNLQFGHDGTSWVPDNTVKYVFTTADYDSLGEEYGDPGYYDNFDVREGKDNYVSPEEIVAYINTVLLNNFPGMAEGQKFNVFYNVYSGINEVWNTKVILTNGVYVVND